MDNERLQRFEEYMESNFGIEEAHRLRLRLREEAPDALYLPAAPIQMAYRWPHPLADEMPGTAPGTPYWILADEDGINRAYVCGPSEEGAKEAVCDLLIRNQMLARFEAPAV